MKKSTQILVIILAILVFICIVIVVNKVCNQEQKPIEEISKASANTSDSATNLNNTQDEINNSDTKDYETKEEEQIENELFGKYYAKAEELMKKMTLEEKVSQMFLARYPETGVLEEIKSQNPGGYILFGRDFEKETKETILEKLTQCQNASKINLALGVDEEGGTVVRVSKYQAFRKSAFESPQKLWEKGQLTEILEDSKEKSELLKSIGLNMNLAPVCDIPSSSSDYIYDRSYGRGTDKTATYVSKLIQTMNNSGMISAMKHFPGYGNNVDTHTKIAIDERPYSTFETSDFLPFKAGIEAGGPTILVSHNIVKCMDENNPASLSPNVHKILREDLGFSGIIMTDDLAMEAVKTYVQKGNAAVQAVNAGNDMIITSDFKTQKNQVIDAVKKGEITEQTINKAVRRILAWKYAYKIIE